MAAAIRHDWQHDELQALFDLPFPELLFRAAAVHREHFDPSQVQVSTLLLTPAVRPATSWFATPRERTFFSYWSINLGFLLRETCRCAHHTFLLGFPTDVSTTRISPSDSASSPI